MRFASRPALRPEPLLVCQRDGSAEPITPKPQSQCRESIGPGPAEPRPTDSVGFLRCFLDISGRGLLLFRLLDAVVAPGSQILELAGDTAGPANFDLLHLFYSAQPKEQAQIVCRAITGSADQLAHMTSAARGHGDQGANGVAIARRPDQLEADPGIAVAAVVA